MRNYSKFSNDILHRAATESIVLREILFENVEQLLRKFCILLLTHVRKNYKLTLSKIGGSTLCGFLIERMMGF